MTEPNLLARGLKRVLGSFLTPTSVAKIESISANFRVIEIQSEDLKQKNWQPGSKIQIDVGGMQFRTFTPIKLDSRAGHLTFLVYRRNGHPATLWIDSLKEGSRADIFGPRSSLDFSQYEGRNLFFGDETSIGAATAFREQNQNSQIFLEVNSLEETRVALSRLRMESCTLIQRSDDDSHLEKLMDDVVLANSTQAFSTAVLTGRARSIQNLRKQIKSKNILAKVVVRAYWADGKKGLD